MSSARFPGKVLAPCAGRPLIDRVVEQVVRVVPRGRVTLATSDQPSDDPLAWWAAERGIDLVRGPLDDVFARFQLCLAARPCDWFFRVCADSPLLEPALLQRALDQAKGDVDLVTNCAPRSFPYGQSVELVRSERFASLAAEPLEPEECEHLTRVYYMHPERFRIVNLESGDPSQAELHWAVDTLDDLRRVERELLARGERAAR